MVGGNLFHGKCKYSGICKFYDRKAVTCASYDAEGGHCGFYREFKEKDQKP